MTIALTGRQQKQDRATSTSRRIAELATNLERRLVQAVNDFTRLNMETKFVALNARIEAGRASGESGRAFDVVAQAIQDISRRTNDVADGLGNEFHDLLKEMREITEELAIRAQGERLSNLALMNIDLIDRNLYERSCDVRWWATDQSVVDALKCPTVASLQHATNRLGQILDSYTVYFDIVIVDLKGRVLANGRPREFRSVNSNQSNTEWFTGALRTHDGTQYVQSDVIASPLCSSQRTMIFASAVRENGKSDGEPLGVLAVVFRWDALAQTIVERTPLSAAEWENSRALIVDTNGRMLADTAKEYNETIQIPAWNDIRLSARGHRTVQIEKESVCVGHARSPGYETYNTGWYSLILQKDDAN